VQQLRWLRAVCRRATSGTCIAVRMLAARGLAVVSYCPAQAALMLGGKDYHERRSGLELLTITLRRELRDLDPFDRIGFA
jgi:hypothetical protein